MPGKDAQLKPAFSEKEQGMPIHGRLFRHLLRERQFRVVAPDPGSSLGRLGIKLRKYGGSEESVSYPKTALFNAVAKMAAEGEWGKIELLRGDIETKVSKKYFNDFWEYWYGELVREINAMGKSRPTFSDYEKHGMRWIIRHQGSVRTAEKFFGKNTTQAMKYNPDFFMDGMNVLLACDGFHESLRRQGGFTADERLALMRIENNLPMREQDIAMMRGIYRDPRSWVGSDLEGKDFASLFAHFGRSTYRVAEFQCSKWFSLLSSEPLGQKLGDSVRQYNREKGKRVEIELTAAQERLLQQKDSVADLGDFKVRNRDGKWELHRKAMPWEMRQSPIKWYENALLFCMQKGAKPDGAMGQWLDSLPAHLREKATGVREGGHLYFAHGGTEYHVFRKGGVVRAEADRRGLLLKFVKWAWEELGITPYKLYTKTMAKLCPPFEEFFTTSIILVKMAEPRIMPADMARASALPIKEIRRRALQIYPDWDRWFEEKYPYLSGRDDGIIRIRPNWHGVLPVPAVAVEAPLRTRKGEPPVGSAPPLPEFSGEDAKLPLNLKVAKFFIEQIGAYAIEWAAAPLFPEVASAVSGKREETARKGLDFSKMEEHSTIRRKIAQIVKNGGWQGLVEAGAIKHNVPKWYVDNGEHARFWIKEVANACCDGDIYRVGASGYIKSGLTRYLKENGVSPNRMLERYFWDELDPSRLREKPKGLTTNHLHRGNAAGEASKQN